MLCYLHHFGSSPGRSLDRNLDWGKAVDGVLIETKPGAGHTVRFHNTKKGVHRTVTVRDGNGKPLKVLQPGEVYNVAFDDVGTFPATNQPGVRFTRVMINSRLK